MSWSRILISAGCVLILAGVAVGLAPRFPWLMRWGRLPGDLRIERENFSLYFPWVSCLLLSGLLTLLSYLWRRFKG